MSKIEVLERVHAHIVIERISRPVSVEPFPITEGGIAKELLGKAVEGVLGRVSNVRPILGHRRVYIPIS